MVIDTQTGENYTDGNFQFWGLHSLTQMEEKLQEHEHAVAVLGRKPAVDKVAELIKKEATHPKGAFR